MGVVPEEAINQFEALMKEVEEPLKRTFQSNYITSIDYHPTLSIIPLPDLFAMVPCTAPIDNVHQGYPKEPLIRFLKAREGNVVKAHKMLVDCLNWRVQNDIDDILAKPIVPTDLYRAIRDSQLIGLSGYSKEGFPVFAHGVGLNTFDKASVHYYIQSHIQINEYRDRVILPVATKKYGKHISKCIKILDMTGLKLSALSQIKLLTIISSIDDLNYPEKTVTYYIVNAPYIFSACWKVVKPLLQERTKRKINVLSGCGQDDLLKIMEYSSLPHFCHNRSSGSSENSDIYVENCYSLDHPFHQQLYNYIKQQSLLRETVKPRKQGSVHVTLPDDAVEGVDIAKTLESELEKFKDLDECRESLEGLRIDNGKS